MDLNVWDHLLTGKEMEGFSDCKKIPPQSGNLINMDSEFNVTGTLVKRVEIDSEELSCAIDYKDISLPVRQRTVKGAEKQCDKLMQKSFGPYLKDHEKYLTWLERISNLPMTGYKDR